ncbi:MAG TPA: ABC transporter ATP-binding protein [Chloroflexota bacterium]|nr:ABC transporter ATP-binding protein [Chloroflexota bacterium]
MAGMERAIDAEHLRRVYPKGGLFRRRGDTVAVDDISFHVPRGTVFGLLGPNGAGKTTTIKMLSTLLIPTAGWARVAGFDVVRQDRAVRRHLGVVLGGDRGLYGKLSARANLQYFGNLYGMTTDSIRRRTGEMLELVGLTERADDRVERFSRGMKQRLHLTKALLHDPPILILDEPTIGLDPAAAIDLRRAIAALVPRHSVLLTTHDMHEADQLCREIAIVDRGRVVAQGTPAELKSRVSGARRVVIETHETLNGRALEVERAIGALEPVRSVSIRPEDRGANLTILCDDTARTLDDTLSLLRRYPATIRTVTVIEPTLEDVFLSVAGRSFE